jgi:hypothetical protein
MGTPYTISDLYMQMHQVNQTLLESIQIQQEALDVQRRIMSLIERIAGDEQPYTQEQYAAWRDRFGKAILSSPALDRRAQNALISAASFDNARRYFLNHEGALMAWPEWIYSITYNPTRALKIRNIGQLTIDRLVAEHGKNPLRIKSGSSSRNTPEHGG